MIKITTVQKDDNTTACRLDYPYRKGHYKMIDSIRFKLKTGT